MEMAPLARKQNERISLNCGSYAPALHRPGAVAPGDPKDAGCIYFPGSVSFSCIVMDSFLQEARCIRGKDGWGRTKEASRFAELVERRRISFLLCIESIINVGVGMPFESSASAVPQEF